MVHLRVYVASKYEITYANRIALLNFFSKIYYKRLHFHIQCGKIYVMNEPSDRIRMSESELASAIRIGGKGLDMKELEFVLDTAYQCFTYQVGYSTDGHKCVDSHDMEEASHSGSSLLYGEVLPQGVSSMLNKQHLAADHSRTMYDLGMGTGKMTLQAFLQFPNLRRVVGIELAHSRYELAERSLTTLVEFFPDVFSLVFLTKGEKVCLRTRNSERILEYRRADLFRIGNINDADIVVLQTDFPPVSYPHLCKFVHALPQGTRLLTYLNLARIWDAAQNPFPFTRYALGSRFLTSWSDKDTGHLFFLWRKTLPTCRCVLEPGCLCLGTVLVLVFTQLLSQTFDVSFPILIYF